MNNTGFDIGDRVISLKSEYMDQEGVVTKIKDNVTSDKFIHSDITVKLDSGKEITFYQGLFMKKTKYETT